MMDKVSEKLLAGQRILLVEDEFLLAMDLQATFIDAGARVVGPVASVAAALDVIKKDKVLDAAVLDINLRGEKVFAVADRLLDDQVPFVFTSGYNSTDIPLNFSNVQRIQKPVDALMVVRAIRRAIDARLA